MDNAVISYSKQMRRYPPDKECIKPRNKFARNISTDIDIRYENIVLRNVQIVI